jgi:choice-of-anchor B domain-containing protein
MKTSKLLAPLFLAAAFSVSTQAQNISQLSLTSLGNDTETHDLWADANNFVYIARGEHGVDIVDAANPQNPVIVSNIRPFAGSGNIDIGDVQVSGNVLYFSNHVPNGGPTPHAGVFMYDISNPAAPFEIGRIEWGAGAWYHLGANAHNLYIDATGNNVIAYVASITSSAVEVFDLTTPAAPVWLSTITPPMGNYGFPGSAHEIVVWGNLCISTWLSGGFTIHDVSNPAAPQLLSYQQYGSAYTYHAWPTDDGLHLCTTDANQSLGLKIWDISNPSQPFQVGTWTGSSSARMHNVMIEGDLAYISYFQDGLRVVDISNRSNPRQIASFDTDPASSSSAVTGSYGIYPFNNEIYLTHSSNGLYVLGLADQVQITSAFWSRSARTLTVYATSSLSPFAELELNGYGPMTFQPNNNRYEITVSAQRKPRSISINSDLGGNASKSVKKIR